MDWAKVKTILIILFILLNVFLFITIMNNNTTLSFQSSYARYATEYLKSKDITIASQIPNVKGKVGVLAFGTRSLDINALSVLVFGKQVEPVEKDDRVIIKEGEESIILKGQTLMLTDKLSRGTELFADAQKFQESVYGYLGALGIQKTQLSQPSINMTEDLRVYHFYMKYKNFLLFDQPISVSINRDGIMSLSLPTREVKRVQSPNEILSIYQILVMGQVPQNSTITQVEFGFKKTGQDDLFDSPVWHILLEDGQSLFYNAYTGEKVL
jgi:regulatory protein YycI of two-component signal transduction system YycFG